MEKVSYVSPQVEVIEIEVEKGFALSIYSGDDLDYVATDAPGVRRDWYDL